MDKKIILFIIMILLIGTPVMAGKSNDLEQRLELIEASQTLIKEKKEVSPKVHKLATVFTTYGKGENLINTGLRIAPQIASPAGMPLSLMGELIYLRQDDELAGFLSLVIEPTNSLYFGAGGEVTDTAEYQVFAGWNITENIFLEARAINDGGSFEESEIHPVTGFEIAF